MTDLNVHPPSRPDLDGVKQVAAIIGQGYVGVPLAQAAAAGGLKVLGFDTNSGLVADLRAGRSHIDDLSDAELSDMLQGGYEPTDNPALLEYADVVVICVPTPLSSEGGPDLSAVLAATRTVGEHLRPGVTVILESTSYPGTTEDLVRPLLEEVSGLSSVSDFFLAFSPERVDPGSRQWGIQNTPKLVGGVGIAAAQSATDFYSKFVHEVITLSGTREAEMAKLLENTYRHVNIALVNELARFCHDLDIDIWEVIRGAATKPFGFQSFKPGPGVGGHCIPIDPNYLSRAVKQKLGVPFRFIELAQEINDSMPLYVAGRISDLLNSAMMALNGASVLLLGVSYKADIADQRQSPAAPLARILHDKGAAISFHDPLIPTWSLPWGTWKSVSDLSTAVGEADIVVLLQAHTFYDPEWLADAASILLDTRGVTSSTNVERL